MILENNVLILERKYKLTPREIEYLSLAALGYKNKMIASILTVSNSTVKKTLEKIFQKLNAKDRANAVAIAFLNGILTPYLLSNIKSNYSKCYLKK